MAGQSNMSGRGGTFVRNAESGMYQGGVRWDGVLPDECKPWPGKIQCYTSAEVWETAAEPLHQGVDTSKACGVGPGLSFARRLVNEQALGSTASIGLVPSAVGNTSIEQWAEGGELFSNAVRRTLAALSCHQGARLAGLLWYQGESDADTEEKATEYLARLTRLFSKFREKLGAPQLPIVQVAVHTTRQSLPFVEQVREAQLGLCLPGLATVDAREHCAARGEDLPDELHLSSAAQCSLGIAMADCFASRLLR
eukprot:CAMPEP_0177755174 /NCGR_PEP_ID=MMETSP0491_2-20121128/2422_1 /TAXON_ID=63592 /ORGANISM="Tetraselmis chuii, Strain PLY429" /LENGTH=252 /DNA_ID=CAMNT_0019270647 /DNA_START=1922 /DNA_END=2680 /DNA_ORIENTATION=-